jgi:hypothetical protein
MGKKELPRTSDGLIELQIFVDPLYGSERYARFNPSWVVEAENRTFRLVWKRIKPTTFIKFKNGQDVLVDGHWADEIWEAQGEMAENEVSLKETAEPT